MPLDVFRLIRKPEESFCKNGWVYESVRLQLYEAIRYKNMYVENKEREEGEDPFHVRKTEYNLADTENARNIEYVYTGISRSRRTAKIHKRQNRLLSWAEDARIGNKVFIAYDLEKDQEECEPVKLPDGTMARIITDAHIISTDF